MKYTKNEIIIEMDGCLPRHGDGWREESDEPVSLAGNCFIVVLSVPATTTLSPPETSRLQLIHYVPYGMRILGAPLRTSNDLHHKIIDHRAKWIA